MIEILAEIGWAEAVAGAGVGYTFGQIPSSARYLKNSLKRDPLIGQWKHHFVNLKDGAPELHIDTLTIKRGYKHKLVFSTEPENYTGDKYSGYMFREKGFLVLVSKALEDEEFICQRFKLPSVGFENLVSLALTHSFDGNGTVNPTVLCKRNLNYQDFLGIVRKSIRVLQNERVMVIK